MLKGAGYRCQRCGSREDLTIDHVRPLSKGGKNRHNLQVLCKSCNFNKQARNGDYRQIGWRGHRRHHKEKEKQWSVDA